MINQLLVLVPQSDVHSTGYQDVAGSISTRSGNSSFVEINHEIFSLFILSLSLIQAGHLSVSDERMSTS